MPAGMTSTGESLSGFFWLRWGVSVAVVLVVQLVALIVILAVASGPLRTMPPETVLAGGAAGLAFATGWLGLAGSVFAARRRDQDLAWLWLRGVLLIDVVFLFALSPIIVNTISRPVQF